MAFNAEGIDQRPEILYGAAADSLVYWPKKDGAVQAVDALSAFVTIFNPSAAQLVARVAATINGNGSLSYSRAWDVATYLLGQDYAVLWEYTSATVAVADRTYFDIVRNKLPCLIDESDLLELYPNLVEHLKAVEPVPDLSKYIRRAWSMMLDRIRSGQNRPSLILDRARLVNPAIHLSLHFACMALARDVDDIWDKRQAGHLKMFETIYAGLGELKYDINEDTVADQEESKRINRRKWTV